MNYEQACEHARALAKRAKAAAEATFDDEAEITILEDSRPEVEELSLTICYDNDRETAESVFHVLRSSDLEWAVQENWISGDIYLHTQTAVFQLRLG